METPKRVPSMIRKPPQHYLNTPSANTTETDDLINLTQSTPDQLQPQPQPPKSPVDKLRFSNPNLQPLSDSQSKKVQKWVHRHSYQPLLPSPPPSSVEEQGTVSSTDYKLTLKSARHSIGSVTDLKTTLKRPFTKTRLAENPAANASQSFWKYHILEFGDHQFYLTTNPDSKHLYCRNAPGIHVELRFPKINNSKDTTGRKGFQLLFRDQKEEEVFMTITKKSESDGGDMLFESGRKFYESAEGVISGNDSNCLERQFLKAQKTEISELRHRTYDDASTRLCRYAFKDRTDFSWNVGSIPSFKPGTSSKLKNKRYIYFHEPKRNNCIACFRPCEQRMKKRIMKRLKGGLKTYVDLENTEESRILTNSGIKAETDFYSAGDGIFKENPPDDSPSDVKLGWITVYDEIRLLKDPGAWEMIVGYTFAVGFDRMLYEKSEIGRTNATHNY